MKWKGWWPVQIADILPSGEGNAIPLRHLESMTGMDGRTIRQAIQSERLRGVPILSNNISGYYMAATAQERDQFVKSMKHRAGEIVKVAEAIQRAGD